MLGVDAELNDTDTASAIWEVLPIQTNHNTSGDEIYLRISDENEVENVQRCRSHWQNQRRLHRFEERLFREFRLN